MTQEFAPTIRTVATHDAPRVASLATQLGYPTTPEEMPQRLDSVIADTGHQVLVAECAEMIVGWIHVYVRKTLAREGDAEIGGLIVDQAYRGRGIGRLLVERALRWAGKNGCRTVTVRSNVVREDTARFYLGLGFKQTKTQSVYRRGLAEEM